MPSHRADTRILRRGSTRSSTKQPSVSASPRRTARAQMVGPSRWAGYVGVAAYAGIVTLLGVSTIVVPASGDVLMGRSSAAEAATMSRSPGQQPQPVEPQQEPSPVTPSPSLRRPEDAPERTERASRAQERPVLPGCDGTVGVDDAPNGQLDQADLCRLWDADHLLRPDAAVAAAELNRAYRAHFGADLCITDSYRSLASQQSLRARKPGLAARPGTSEHGWGLAVDLCDGVETGAGVQFDWIGENASRFGWHNPDWARAGGDGPYEPWHWEFTPPAG